MVRPVVCSDSMAQPTTSGQPMVPVPGYSSSIFFFRGCFGETETLLRWEYTRRWDEQWHSGGAQFPLAQSRRPRQCLQTWPAPSRRKEVMRNPHVVEPMPAALLQVYKDVSFFFFLAFVTVLAHPESEGEWGERPGRGGHHSTLPSAHLRGGACPWQSAAIAAFRAK